jgi:hypothetical protein|tara:strand:- start:598 stop:1374 length:777 start_codon:yes stop_codon:yes gene_type:complete
MAITIDGTGSISGVSSTGISAAQTVNASSITAGTLAVANGGTGASTLTANNVILGNGTSAPSFVAPGTNGNVLTSNGTTWTSAAGGGGSPLVFLGTTLITSAVATVGFTGFSSSTYIAIMVQYQGMEPGSDVNNLRLQIGNSSSGYLSSGYYSNILTNGATNENTGSSSSWKLTNDNVRSSTNGGCNGIAWISQVANSSTQPSFFSDTSWWGYAPYTSRAGGALDTSAAYFAFTQVRLYYASGNVNNGRVSVYGLKAS